MHMLIETMRLGLLASSPANARDDAIHENIRQSATAKRSAEALRPPRGSISCLRVKTT
jgi:hypothetical protein